MPQLINQPFNGQLGTILNDKLSKDTYKYFIIISAFAKNSGVLRMKESIQNFRDSGGTVDAFIGLDAHGTSYEAVLNLFYLVDNLYIVHDKNPVVTFHSKAYYLSDLKNSDWMAVGSNNLTGGGLWTNYESAIIIDTDSKIDIDMLNTLNDLKDLVSSYKAETCAFSLKINDVGDLDKLLDADLLRHEIQLQIDTAKSMRESSKQKNKFTVDPFGTLGRVHIPRVKKEGQGKKIIVNDRNVQVTSAESIAPSDDSEKMWFETREMTGGSRNILDLSMLGSLIHGTGDGTRYKTDKNSSVLGSVVFFDIDPTNVTFEKDITINYNAKDYVGCTIKLHQSGKRPNGSWRIQLKGETVSNEKLTSAEDGEWLVHKIIILEKIRTDYYVMSVLPESELDNLKSESIFVARNGSNHASKQYGLLNI